SPSSACSIRRVSWRGRTGQSSSGPKQGDGRLCIAVSMLNNLSSAVVLAAEERAFPRPEWQGAARSTRGGRGGGSVANVAHALNIKLSGREVGSARRAKKNHAEREVLDVVGVCWIRTYRTMADMMKGFNQHTKPGESL